MGYLLSGPVGTGKSFMVTAFAGESGIPIVKFRNFRSKRQGRAEEHLALFYPETLEEKHDLFDTLVRKLALKIAKVNIIDLLKRNHFDFSGADLESILIRAKFLAAMNNHVNISKEDLEQTVRDFVPPAYPHEIELQNLAAVLECTSREMLPRRFQNLSREKLIQDIQELKLLLGERETSGSRG